MRKDEPTPRWRERLALVPDQAFRAIVAEVSHAAAATGCEQQAEAYRNDCKTPKH